MFSTHSDTAPVPNVKHSENASPPGPFTTIALFGANGQIGERILNALLSNKQHKFKVLAFVPPETELQQSSHDNVDVKVFDLKKLNKDELAKDLHGVEAVVSALNGPALDAQATIQDSAAAAGVKRFYPSEYGFHHIYRKPGDSMGYIHPAWNQKAQYVVHTISPTSDQLC
jgi:N-acetyl-gamma-glutamylphosphate reductase